MSNSRRQIKAGRIDHYDSGISSVIVQRAIHSAQHTSCYLRIWKKWLAGLAVFFIFCVPTRFCLAQAVPGHATAAKAQVPSQKAPALGPTSEVASTKPGGASMAALAMYAPPGGFNVAPPAKTLECGSLLPV